MTKKKLEATIKNVTPEYAGRFLKINKYEIEKDLHEGGKQDITWLIMERGNAVGILAYDPVEDQVILVNEMRSGILAAGGYPYTDTLPAGGIGKNETPVDAAIREMKEETGLDLADAKIIHDKAYVSAGGTSESISIVFGIVAAKKAGGIHGLAEEMENIKSTILTSEEFMAQIRSGEINDMKTIIAGYWLMENRDRLMKEYDPRPGYKQKAIDAVKANGSVDEITDAIKQYAADMKWNRIDGFISRQLNLVGLYLAQARLDLIEPTAALMQGEAFSFRSDCTRGIAQILGAPFMYEDNEKAMRENLFKAIAAMDKPESLKLIGNLQREFGLTNGYYISTQQAMARLLKDTGNVALLDTWLDEAKAWVERAKKDPHIESYSESGDYINGNINNAQSNMRFVTGVRTACGMENPPEEIVAKKMKSPKPKK